MDPCGSKAYQLTRVLLAVFYSPRMEYQCISLASIHVIISNPSDSVSSGYPNTEKRVENMMRRVFFDEIHDLWIADKTLFRVFDISSQLKQNLTS